MKKEKVCARPRTTKELCAIYQLSSVTMRRMIQAAGLTPRRQAGTNYFSIIELQQLVEAIGEPDTE